MTSRKKGAKVSVEEIWRNKVIKKETNGGGSGGLKLRDQWKALEEHCGGLVGGNEEHGRGVKVREGVKEREAVNKDTENHTEQNSEGSNTYKIIR